jgi:hypothetical protein
MIYASLSVTLVLQIGLLVTTVNKIEQYNIPLLFCFTMLGVH